MIGKVSAQPHTTLCIQFLDKENNDKNNTLPLGKQICFTIVWGCAEILPSFFFQDKIQKGLTMSKKSFTKNAETEREVTKLQYLS